MPAPKTHDNLIINQSGWLQGTDSVSICKSPNHNQRPENEAPSLVVIHNISLPPGIFNGTAIMDFFMNQLDYSSHPWFENIRGVTVSAHFLLHRNGHIVQFVATTMRAWHAGISSFKGRDNCNDFSIGIELEGTDDLDYTEQQYDSLQQLLASICQRHPVQWITGHSNIAPERKTDPGPAFDWYRVSLPNQVKLALAK